MSFNGLMLYKQKVCQNQKRGFEYGQKEIATGIY